MSILHFIFILIPLALTMSTLQSTQLQDRKIESLQTQQDFLNLLRRRHLHWMNAADDREIEHLHLEIAESIRLMTELYIQLLDTLEHKE
jgi:hypothetical protein